MADSSEAVVPRTIVVDVFRMCPDWDYEYRLVEAVSRWPRWRGRLIVRQWEPEDRQHEGTAPVIVDGRFPVDPVNVKTVRAALEAADAEPAMPQEPSA